MNHENLSPPKIYADMVHTLSIYIIQFVCLVVRDSCLNYAKYSHQSLRDYRDLPGRTTPRIGVTRPVVSMAFPSTSGIRFAADRHILIMASWHFRFLRACCYTAGSVRSINQWDTRVYTGKKTKLERHD